MPYDKGLDKELFQRDIETENGILRVSVWSYNQNEAKIQIGPRITLKKDGSEGFRKAGRITNEEFQDLLQMSKDIVEVIEENEGGG
jgi:hypothetical protein